MRRTVLIALAVAAAMTAVMSPVIRKAMATGGTFTGPGPGVTGNDTGGIFPYSPAVEGIAQDIAQHHCARYGRLAKITSIHRQYGDYVSFVCYDRPGMIH